MNFVEQVCAVLGNEAASEMLDDKVDYHHQMNFEAPYRMQINLNRKPVRPVPLDLAGVESRQRVLDAARRVMATYADVLAALARR